jgi:CRISPR-associated exonuclease Cas4
MDRSAILTVVIVMLAAAALLAMISLTAATYFRQRSGLPRGEVVYDDASGLAGDILVSKRYGLSGKPDYLLDDESGGLIPVEVKSGAAPRTGKPYDSHLMQLAAYFLLVEDALGRSAPYGLIRYKDRTLRVANTEKLRAALLDLLERMRESLRHGAARRNHSQTRRCAGCSVAEACDERLA